jgi:hypothetical protein
MATRLYTLMDDTTLHEMMSQMPVCDRHAKAPGERLAGYSLIRRRTPNHLNKPCALCKIERSRAVIE